MGIHGFFPFLKKKYPHLFRKEHLSILAYTRVFIDISGYIYKYISIFGKHDSKWIHAILQLLQVFRQNKVIPVPVFDGKPPSQKQEELDDRKEKKQTHQARLHALQEAIQAYEEGTYTDTHQSLLKLELQKSQKRHSSEGSTTSYLQSYRQAQQKTVPFTLSDIQQLKDHVSILSRQFVSITGDDIQSLKEALTDSQFTFLQAPGESEGYCCTLTREGEGSAVVSADSDCLIQGAEVLLTQVERNGMIVYLEYSELLATLHLTPSQLIDYGIIMGCDYNKHCRNHKLGPVQALKLIHQYGSIEGIPDSILDKSQLLTEQCREMFHMAIDQPVSLSHSAEAMNTTRSTEWIVESSLE